MQTIFDLKEQPVTDTPLLVFDCVLPDGQTESWSTHQVTIGESTHAARVLQHNVFEIQTASDQGVDGMPRISFLLANADAQCSEIERSTGWKGARLTVGFLFYDLRKAYRRAKRGDLPGYLQSAGRDSGSHVPHYGDESDEPAAACCCRRCGSSGDVRGNFRAARDSGRKRWMAGQAASTRGITGAVTRPG